MRRGWAPADPPQRPVLFMNPKSGGGKAARADLGRRARDRGIDVIVLRPDDSFVALVGEAIGGGADALGVAGGDGSMAVVAAAAVEHRLPLICVPAGTRNHFALDLGIDRQDLVGALDAFGDHGVERSIDVAEVNGRVFLNNVSLGIYGNAVQRSSYRDAKVRTLLETSAEVLGPSRAAPNCASSTTSATSIVTPPSCSCRTIPTRSTAPLRPGRGHGSTAASSASWCSINRTPARILRPEPGQRRTSGWSGRIGACRHRRRSCRIGRAARVRDPSGRAARQDLVPSSRRLAVGTPEVKSGHDRSVSGVGRGSRAREQADPLDQPTRVRPPRLSPGHARAVLRRAGGLCRHLLRHRQGLRGLRARRDRGDGVTFCTARTGGSDESSHPDDADRHADRS